MKKKAYLSTLLLLVLYTLLNLSSISYSTTGKVLEKEDIANFIYNYATYYKENHESFVLPTKEDIAIGTCETISNTFNEKGDWYILADGTTVYFITFNNYTTISATLSSGKYRIICNGTNKYIRYNMQTKNFAETSFVTWGRVDLKDYYYINCNAYENNVIKFTFGDQQPTNINMFEANLITNDYFDYIYNINLNDIQVEDFNLMKQVNNSNINDEVAEFGLYTNIDLTNYKPTYTIYKYMKPQNYFEAIQTYDFTNYSYVNDTLGNVYLPYKMVLPNTIIEINLFPNDLETFSPLSILFYVTDSNTIITTDSATGNPTLDEDNTFTDDYYTKYTNIIDSVISDYVGKITNPSGEVTGNIDFGPVIENDKSLFDKAFNISGEKIDEIFEEAKSKINIESGEIAEYEIIKNYLEGQPGDFIISWQRKPTHLSIGGTQIDEQLYFDSNSTELGNNQINFSQLERQNEDLQEALTWSRTIIAFALYSLIIHEGYILLLSTLGVGVGIYGTKQEEKAILRRQQEEKEEKQRSQEQRWKDQLERQKYREWLYKNRKR